MLGVWGRGLLDLEEGGVQEGSPINGRGKTKVAHTTLMKLKNHPYVVARNSPVQRATVFPAMSFNGKKRTSSTEITLKSPHMMAHPSADIVGALTAASVGRSNGRAIARSMCTLTALKRTRTIPESAHNTLSPQLNPRGQNAAGAPNGLPPPPPNPKRSPRHNQRRPERHPGIRSHGPHPLALPAPPAQDNCLHAQATAQTNRPGAGSAKEHTTHEAPRTRERSPGHSTAACLGAPAHRCGRRWRSTRPLPRRDARLAATPNSPRRRPLRSSY